MSTDSLPPTTWQQLPSLYALLGFSELPTPEDFATITGPLGGQFVREGDESTLFVPESALETVLQRHPTASVERDLHWYRFDAPMAWDVVGFLAHVTAHLARAGVPLGAICAYSRDYLFVSARFEAEARRGLVELFPEAER